MTTRLNSGYRAIFAVSEYRPVFLAHVLTMLGTVVSEVALALLVYRMTGSPFLTAATYAVGFVPYALGGTVLASIADRYPARTVLVVCNLISAVTVATMAAPALPIVALMALRFASATVAPIFGAARAASIPDIVPGDGAVLARSLVRVVSQGSQIVGFGLGGLLLTLITPRQALLGEAAAFAVSAVLLRFGTRWRPARTAEGNTMLGESLRGLRLLMGDRRIAALFLLWWVPPTFVVVPEALAAPYTHGIGVGPIGFGLFMTAMPVGTVLGELAAGLLPTRLRPRIVPVLAGCTLLPLLVFGTGPGLPVALGALLVTGLCSAYLVGLDQRFLASVPTELGGRAMAAMSAGMMVVQGLGMAAGGALAEIAAPRTVILLASAVGTVSVLAVLAWVRHTHRPQPAALLST